MRRSKRRYVRDDEIKYRMQGPKDGQIVQIRIYGNKTYHTTIYDCLNNEFRGVYSGAVWDGKYVMGWIPLTPEQDMEVRQHLIREQEKEGENA